MTMNCKKSFKSDMSRITFLTTVTSGTASIIFTPSAIAANENDAAKGTTKDPKYETCVAVSHIPTYSLSFSLTLR